MDDKIVDLVSRRRELLRQASDMPDSDPRKREMIDESDVLLAEIDNLRSDDSSNIYYVAIVGL